MSNYGLIRLGVAMKSFVLVLVLVFSSSGQCGQFEDFDRLDQWIKGRVASDKEGGIQLVIEKDGEEVHEIRAGNLKVDTPMPSDAIFLFIP